MEQQDLFTGEQLRDYGITAAQQDRELVCQAVDTAIRICAFGTDDGFTAEDVRNHLGRYVRDLPDVSKVIGGRIRAAAVAGLIHTTGETITATRPDAHARRMLIWRRTAGLLEVLT
jgi:hypothetical protein